MTYYPRLVLTPEEKEWCCKYYDPYNPKPAVLYRMYPGVLELNSTQRNPIFPFEISRRCRIWGLDMAGDIRQMRLEMQETAGEQYLANPIEPALLLTGANEDVQSSSWIQTIANNPDNFPVRGSRGDGDWYPQTAIFDPNIVLRPNQTLTLRGEQTQDPVAVVDAPPFDDELAPFRIDFTLHVWEFPGMQGGAL